MSGVPSAVIPYDPFTADVTSADLPLVDVGTYGFNDAAFTSAAAAAAGKTIVCTPGTYNIAADMTITAPLLMLGGIIKPASGVTVHINGPFESALKQCFDISAGGTIMFGSAANQWANTYVKQVHPEWWGVVGNTGSFDTAAVQAAINTHLPVVFSRHYYVTTILLEGNELFLDARNYALMGVSTTPNTDACLQIQCGYSTLRDVRVDLDFNTNYKAAVRWFGDASHTNPQYNTIHGLHIEDALVGLVIGAHVTYTDNGSAYTVDTPYDCPLSESTIIGLRTWSVERAVTMNQPNGKVQLINPTIVATKGNWTGDGSTTGSYRYNRSYAVLNVPAGTGPTVGGGELAIHGGQVVANDTTSQIGIRGANMLIQGAIWECLGNHGQIEGDRVIVTGQLNGGGTDTPWVIASTARGQLRFDGCTFNRNSDGGIFVVSNVADPRHFQVVITDTEVRGWTWSHTSQMSGLAQGCPTIIKGLTYSDTALSFRLRIRDNTAPSIFTGANPNGGGMSTVADMANKDGWTWASPANAGNFLRRSATAPTGFTDSIELSNAGAGTTEAYIDSATFRVTPDETRIFESWVRTSAAGANVIIDLYWYKWDGVTASATASTRPVLVTGSILTVDTWRLLMQYVTVPADAQWAKVRLYNSPATTTFFTGIRL